MTKNVIFWPLLGSSQKHLKNLSLTRYPYSLFCKNSWEGFSDFSNFFRILSFFRPKKWKISKRLFQNSAKVSSFFWQKNVWIGDSCKSDKTGKHKISYFCCFWPFSDLSKKSRFLQNPFHANFQKFKNPKNGCVQIVHAATCTSLQGDPN